MATDRNADIRHMAELQLTDVNKQYPAFIQVCAAHSPQFGIIVVLCCWYWYYARLIFKACRQDHVQPLLRRLHWLPVPERISFRLAVLVYRCLNGSAPDYLASDLQHVSHLNARRRLRSSTTSALVVPRTMRATIGDRTFPAAAASVWNSLPESVRASPSLQVFRRRLKTKLFARSYSCSD